MNTALQRCTNECHPLPSAAGFLPTRLLDLGDDPKSTDVRLVLSCDIPERKTTAVGYAALSYCWGLPEVAKTQLKLYTETLEDMRRLIPATSMTQALRDAVTVCKSLSIRYLWVDSVCIIQNSKEDWEKESVCMALVYRHALVTICALSSKSCQETFLSRNRRGVELNFESRVGERVKGSFSLVASGRCIDRHLFGWPDIDLSASALDTRGWCLQEGQVSTRLLYFGQSMIHFQCSDVVSENGVSDTERDSNMSFILASLEEDPDETEWCYTHWTEMLMTYGKRELTNEGDRLPGLSGMASMMADITGDEYLAGLWKSDLARGLLWHPYANQSSEYRVQLPQFVEKLLHPDPYIAPSWSPLRLHGIRFESELRFEQSEQGYEPEFELVQADIGVEGLNPFGKIQHGCLRIRGKLTGVPSDLHEIKNWWQPGLWMMKQQGGMLAYCNVDWDPVVSRISSKGLFMLLTSSTTETPSVMSAIRREGLREPTIASEHDDSLVELEPANDTPREDMGVVAQGEAPDDERDAYGLLLHRASEPGKYVRVGVWASIVADGAGLKYFNDVGDIDVDII